ncbi:hypothetical protein GCM10009106_12480 [Sphingomonas japonica]
MVDGATAERVHTQLKAAIMAGAVSMHARLDIAELAGQFAVGTTPVREAAMRLWGEQLLEVHPKGGLRAVLATEARLRGLLDLNERLATAAIASAVATVDRAPSAATSVEARARAIFRTIAARTGNPALVTFIEGLSDRLAVFRTRELEIMEDADGDLNLLEAALHDATQMRRALRRYHRRRLANAPEFVWAATANSIAGGV